MDGCAYEAQIIIITCILNIETMENGNNNSSIAFYRDEKKNRKKKKKKKNNCYKAAKGTKEIKSATNPEATKLLEQFFSKFESFSSEPSMIWL